MKSRKKSYIHFILGSLWLITALLNVINAVNKNLSIYTWLVILNIALSIFYISLGFKERKKIIKENEKNNN
ncbi:MAG: hypothetical protein ACOWWR_17215 [Eubacteriales bacterium]